MNDIEWSRSVAAGEDAGWKLVWDKVVEPESRSMRSAELMLRYSLTAGDLMGMLYQEMIARDKISLYRGEGSFQGWLRRYVRGFVLAANPNAHGEISIENADPDAEGAPRTLDIAVRDENVSRNDVWTMTHRCFHDLWRKDPERAYIHLLKTRFHLSSDEVCAFLDVSSPANVDQIFSRSVKFMRSAWVSHEKNG